VKFSTRMASNLAEIRSKYLLNQSTELCLHKTAHSYLLSIHTIRKRWLVAWLVDHVLLRDFGTYGIFTTCVVINLAMVMLRDFGLYVIIFTAVQSFVYDLPRICIIYNVAGQMFVQ
jgi:hypothetical protein